MGCQEGITPQAAIKEIRRGRAREPTHMSRETGTSTLQHRRDQEGTDKLWPDFGSFIWRVFIVCVVWYVLMPVESLNTASS